MEEYRELLNYMKYSLNEKLNELKSAWGNSPDDSNVHDPEAQMLSERRCLNAIEKIQELEKILLN